MKKVVKFVFIIFLIISVGVAGFVISKIFEMPYVDDDNFLNKFDNEGRYDDSVLDYMDVIYENQSNINAVNEAYSNTDNCPWGFVHEGFDYFFNNNSAVLAAAPGKVIEIVYTDNGEGIDNRYYVTVWIRFNNTVEIGYNFESWTTNNSDWENQKSMIGVQEGDWVEQNQESAHIHFDVIENNDRKCQVKYYSSEGYAEIMDLIHSYHPDWDYCYIE